MNATGQSQPGSGNGPAGNYVDASTTQCETQQQIINQFGDYGPLDGYEDEEYTIGEEKVIAWIPDQRTAPFGIVLSHFTTAASWQEGFTTISEEEVRVYAVDAGDDIHVVDAAKVDSLADAVGTTPESLLDGAKTLDEKEHYAPMFTVPEGYVLVSPLIRCREAIDF